MSGGSFGSYLINTHEWARHDATRRPPPPGGVRRGVWFWKWGITYSVNSSIERGTVRSPAADSNAAAVAAAVPKLRAAPARRTAHLTTDPG
jgi:hypothetical protein